LSRRRFIPGSPQSRCPSRFKLQLTGRRLRASASPLRCPVPSWTKRTGRVSVVGDPETDVPRRRVGIAPEPRRDPVPIAIARVAQIGPTLHRALRLCCGVPIALAPDPRHRAGSKWVLTPFPDISDHVVEASRIGRESIDRSRPCVAIRRRVEVRKASLPDVAENAGVSRLLVAPWKATVIRPSSRSLSATPLPQFCTTKVCRRARERSGSGPGMSGTRSSSRSALRRSHSRSPQRNQRIAGSSQRGVRVRTAVA
jgi:hypothetical protein